MNHRLAVMFPAMGKPSETFLKRHADELSDAVVTMQIVGGAKENWTVDKPTLAVHERRRFRNIGFSKRVRYWVQARRGKLPNDPVDLAALFLRDHRVDTVLVEYLDFAVRFLDLKRRHGFRFFAHAHGYDLSSAYRNPETREALRQLSAADGIIVVNQVMRARLLELGIAEEKIVNIPYGVAVPASFRARQLQDVVRCLAVGRMVPKKAPLLLLESFRLAAMRDPRLRLDYVGHGPLFDEATQYVRRHGLENVRLLGAQSHAQVLALMRESDLFVQHSVVAPDGDEEGVPVSILEALAHGIPVVSTRHAGIPEAIVHEATGLLVAEGDVQAMAEAMVQLAADHDRRTGMGRAAWEDVRVRFAAERESAELRKFMGLNDRQ